ncbi:MAG: hypothetical protein LBH85_00775 [Treponema sp.]|jgi:hypothetical protein|nr:hypothetical protein [Treponema sp.]
MAAILSRVVYESQEFHHRAFLVLYYAKSVRLFSTGNTQYSTLSIIVKAGKLRHRQKRRAALVL